MARSLAAVFIAVPLLLAPSPPVDAPIQGGSGWRVRTSAGFDALCALNILSGDSFYVAEYPSEARVFGEARYAEARAAAQRLKAVIKDQGGGIVSAYLTLIFSGGPDSSIAALLAEANHPAGLERSLRASPYWSDETWQLFERVRADGIAALEGMQQAGFESDWRKAMGEDPAARAVELRDSLARYDVLGEQERLIGHPLASGIEVIVLYYSRPHGIRIQGERFLTNVDYPLRVVLRNAAHEPFHPPFDPEQPSIRAMLQDFAADSLIRRIVATHDPAYGYNTVDGYVDEDAVQALEQVVSERLGFASPAARRWQAADDGMHLLAAALYDLMEETGFAAGGGRFADWLVDQHTRQALRPSEIERRARRVLGDAAVDRWKALATGQPKGRG
jgi:hypothetical protein